MMLTVKYVICNTNNTHSVICKTDNNCKQNRNIAKIAKCQSISAHLIYYHVLSLLNSWDHPRLQPSMQWCNDMLQTQFWLWLRLRLRKALTRIHCLQLNPALLQAVVGHDQDLDQQHYMQGWRNNKSFK